MSILNNTYFMEVIIMNSKYIDLFDTLVKAYYEGNFDDTLDTIMVCHEKSPQDTFNIITSLCGVDVKFDNNYKYNLKKAITTHAVTQKIVKKLDCSSTNCSKDNNNKFTCQRACPFNAIMFDNNNNSTYINSLKSIFWLLIKYYCCFIIKIFIMLTKLFTILSF